MDGRGVQLGTGRDTSVGENARAAETTVPADEPILSSPLLLDDEGLARVLDALYAARGLDFRQYRPTTIRRRLERRMAAVRAVDADEYLRLVCARPAELDDLIDCLTLKVTAFFRDARAFDLLAQTVVPDLEERCRRQGRATRVWSAGCATGEEVYSLAMLLLDSWDEQCTHAPPSLLGTDIDERALAMASAGVFGAMQLQGVSREILERWFVPIDSKEAAWQICPRLAAVASFRFHDLAAPSDTAPLLEGGQFDLVQCANVLIYMQRPLQTKALEVLDRHLAPGGYLVLGEAETLLEPVKARYVALDRRARVFRKRNSSSGM